MNNAHAQGSEFGLFLFDKNKTVVVVDILEEFFFIFV